jgi:hypothetical protein
MPCSDPGLLEQLIEIIGNDRAELVGQSATLTGYCRATPAGSIAAGPVVVTVRASRSGPVDCLVGDRAGFLEVEEVEP